MLGFAARWENVLPPGERCVSRTRSFSKRDLLVAGGESVCPYRLISAIGEEEILFFELRAEVLRKERNDRDYRNLTRIKAPSLAAFLPKESHLLLGMEDRKAVFPRGEEYL